jgi:hypothetical protein
LPTTPIELIYCVQGLPYYAIVSVLTDPIFGASTIRIEVGYPVTRLEVASVPAKVVDMASAIEPIETLAYGRGRVLVAFDNSASSVVWLGGGNTAANVRLALLKSHWIRHEFDISPLTLPTHGERGWRPLSVDVPGLMGLLLNYPL